MSQPIRSPDDLRANQRLISRIVEENDAQLVISGMGSGKTGATLDAAVKMLNRLEVNHILVIAPKFVAKNTWPDEAKAWSHTQAISVAVAVGDPITRREAIQRRAEITTINTENLQWLAKFIKSVENWYWDMVVIDESSRFKAGEGRTKATKYKDSKGEVKVREGGNMTRFGVMTTARRKIKRIVELTGTPAPKGLIDLWGQAYLLDQGRALGRDKSDFERKWFDKDKYTHVVSPRANAEAEILERLRHLLVTIPQEKVVPDPQFIPMKVTLPEKAMADYREFEKTLYSEPYDIEAVSSGVLANKLMQFCIAKGTPVLTKRGWTPIEKVRMADVVWDGVDWVKCDGVVARGTRPVVPCWGVYMTSDHRVLTKQGWATAKEINNGEPASKFTRPDIWLPDGHRSQRHHSGEMQKGDVALPVCVRQRGDSRESEPEDAAPTERNAVLRMQARCDDQSRNKRPHDDRDAPLGHMAGFKAPLFKSKIPRLSQLRRARDNDAPRVGGFFRGLLGRCFGGLRRPSDVGSDRCERTLQQTELPMGHLERTGEKHSVQSYGGHTLGENDSSRGRGEVRSQAGHNVSPLSDGEDGLVSVEPGHVEETFDLVECGPRNRFVVLGRSGPLIVHNCNGSLYREDRSVVHIHDEKLEALQELSDSCGDESLLIFYGFKFDKDRIKERFPEAVVANEYRGDLVADWNKGRIKRLLAHPASIGHGTNLQYGGHIACWYGLTFSLELWQQANMRLPRPGQTEQVLIYPIIARGTYDERAIDILQDRESTQDRIISNFIAQMN